MINHISGVITATTQGRIILAAGPIGFALQVPNSSAFTLNQKVTMQIYMHWNQESGPTLFGFVQEVEKQLFILIIGCSGIGPKIALSALSHMSPSEFVQAIQTGNDRTLSAINGIGLKKAEQMIVQLKHKISKLLDTGFDLGASSAIVQQRHQIVEVLKSLNYSRTEINGTVSYLNEHYADTALPFDQLMRHALAFLAKKI